MAAMAASKLTREEVQNAEPTVMRKRRKKKVEVPEHLKGTRIGKEMKEGKRRSAPTVPANVSLDEVLEMDPDDPRLKSENGHRKPRTTGKITKDEARDPNTDWTAAARADRQRRFNARRAKGRKAEATISKAVEVLDAKQRTSAHQRRKGVFDEDVTIAEGILSLDDWDDEELIRGYRRNRSGSFGNPPKFIPREIQQEIFRRIVARGDSKMRAAYIGSVEELVELARGASSEKVRLEAIRELQNRVVGKVPDRVHVAQEQPWESFLADSIQPIGDEWEPEAPQGEAVDRPALPVPKGSDYAGKAPTEVQE